MKTAMVPPRRHRARIALAAVFLLAVAAAGAAFAEDDEFSEPWLEQREREMTEKLTSAIETDGSETVTRNVGSHLDGAAPAPAALAPDADADAAAPTDSRMSCSPNPDHTITCVVHHTAGSPAE